MIPSVLVVAFLISCGKSESQQSHSITVEQRHAAIESATELLQSNQVEEALAITSTLIANDSDTAQSQEIHALALIAEGWRLDGIGEFGRAQEKREEALEAYLLACKKSSSPGLLQLSTAQLAQMIGNEAVAIKYYKLAHLNVPHDGRASFFLAQISMLNKQWEEGKGWIIFSLERNPNEPFALLSYALIEAELENYPHAKELATQGCTIAPNDPNLRFMQARVLRLSGHPTRALELLLGLPKDLQHTQVCQDEILEVQKEVKQAGERGG